MPQLEKKISCIQCIGYYKLLNIYNPSCSTSSSSPVKGLLTSSESSFILPTFNAAKIEEKLSNDLSKIREKIRAIQEKYSISHSKISKTDQRILNNLKKQER